jgi:putative lipoprotein
VKRGLGAVVALCLVLRARPSRAADPDPWLGRDKALHFVASSVIAGGGYAVGTALFDSRGAALLFCGALSAAAGIGKETLDLAGFGDPSFRDLAWDGIGLCAGLAVAWTVDVLVRGVTLQHPAFAAPHAGRHGTSLIVRF